MTEYLTEQEQIQHLKQLARQYIPAILTGLVLAFALSTGWHAWQNHQDKVRMLASTGFEAMLAADQQGKTAEITEDASILINQYPKTIYASQAALLLAEQAVRHGRLKEATTWLNTVIERGHKTGLHAIASLRLARVQLALHDATSALQTLDTIKDPAFAGLQNAIRGDALIASHKPADAAKAWTLALQQLPTKGLLFSVLQMKLDALPSSLSGTST